MKHLWCIAMVCVALASCMSNHTSAVIDTPPRGWSGALTMAYHNADTLSAGDVGVILYYEAAAPDSVELVVEVASPDGYASCDTVVCYTPRGESRHNYYERKVVFRRGTVMRCAGDYQVTFTPTDTLDGVWAVGLIRDFN